MKLIIVAALFAIASPLFGQTAAHSTRVGDMEVTVMAVRIASDKDIEDYGLHPQVGHKEVLVFLRMKNLAKFPSCSNSQAWLIVKQGYNYPRSYGLKLNAPKTTDVLPMEDSFGEFAFEIKDGTEPVALRLVREIMGDDLCASFQHRDARISGPESVSLSLLGLPDSDPQIEQLHAKKNKPITQPVISIPALQIGSTTEEDKPQTADAPRAGTNGYGAPTCLYCPPAQFSAEAAKAKHQGTVLVSAIIGADGRVTDARIVKSVGLGLDDNAIAAVRTWRYKPASGPNGQPAAVRIDIPVVFHLY